MEGFDLPFQWDDGKFLAPFVVTSDDAINDLKQLLAASLSASDVFIDIGCGDGRVVLELASSLGCRGIGIDLDAELIDKAISSSQSRHDVQFFASDARDLSIPPQDAPLITCVYTYLLVEALEVLMPIVLQKLPNVKLIVTNTWRIPTMPAVWECQKLGDFFLYRKGVN